MKFFVFSDLHGDVENMKKLQIAIEKTNPDLIFILGDIFSNRSASNYYDDEYIVFALNQYAYKTRAVRGNCDYNNELISKLKFELRNYDEIILKDKKMLLTHGHQYSSYDFSLEENDIFISGHTHRILNEIDGLGVIHLNPGSASIPRGFTKESYLLINENQFDFYTVDGELIKNFQY